ncbi:MAG: WG repeat-containing protein [Clostridia bacterium]|nr:WG repeat-containing protein [Clostridia bacterium]
MKTRKLSILLSAMLVLSVLSGCEKAPTQQFTPLTGTYQGQNISLQYDVITDFSWSQDMSPIVFYNGYANFYYEAAADGDQTSQANSAGFTCMDITGNRTINTVYPQLSPFDEDGIAVAAKNTTSNIEDIEWVFVDAKGTERGLATEADFENRNDAFDRDVYNTFRKPDNLNAITKGEEFNGNTSSQNALIDTAGRIVVSFPEEFNSVTFISENLVAAGVYPEYYYLYNTSGTRLHDTAFEKIGSFYNGLAPFLQDGKLGLLSAAGEIVIPATYATEINPALRWAFYEDRMVVEHEGRIAILTITRK